jgi:hypothetical protein
MSCVGERRIGSCRRGGTASDRGPFRPAVPGIRADVGGGVPAQAAPDYGEQGDAAAVDGEGGIVEGRPSPGGGGAPMAAAAEPLWRVGAVGHQHPRLAGGRGETIYLISMIDDATSRLFARFVRHDTSEENMRLLWSYLERFGRPLAFYTDKAGMFQVAVKSKRQEQREGPDRQEMPPTQIARALRRVGHRLDSGTFAPGQGARRAPVSDGAGPLGERYASGQGVHHRSGQRVPGGRVFALVE